ncbi:RNA-directed DNA polymerase [Bathymodiolus platifrons methanotrophic gill symbiont]|uniref:retron Ec67 family RNA-directed DNA polymerase/endonuclease n=1 Tax=Bathymodiolus platifrons methanotrophic gill symbiont TaxID=113268 RepID=UPI001B47D733|nr:retron Ec67 family RNA-directed DNA polymerase/endonuclease [Bathymodiolus platifrons methanotrophic gill symbiont]GFO77180.1 RNA-directed DNA polymerase [Bathymodiolus platifrons methanotrophic gill symbiont]
MKNLSALKDIRTKPELAKLLDVTPQNLTYTLYKIGRKNLYISFDIPKRNGGIRTIYAPVCNLKLIQSRLSNLLQDCIDEINNKPNKSSKLAHGFVRKGSIITNANVHKNQKYVLNIDLSNFFDSFNFGRVRGFFIKNRNFELDPHIATVLANIACFNNKLPQGSPCSPVITNLITHSLDIRLASLAKKNSCSYSRYADDITISTRKAVFPNQIMEQHENGKYLAGKKLTHEITRAGFSINEKKTRIQHQYSKQDVTGLTVNKKLNVKKIYWRTVRSQCYQLFCTGTFYKTTYKGSEQGNINELEGQLNFIDQVDHFNRIRKTYNKNLHNSHHRKIGNSRERLFGRFLFFRSFYGNSQPTILCEGKTDIIYLKSAIKILATDFPNLARNNPKKGGYKLLIRFIKNSNRTNFFMDLPKDGGYGCLVTFMKKFNENSLGYKAPSPQHPVIIVVDNDKGFDNFTTAINQTKKEYSRKNKSTINPSNPTEEKDYRKKGFIHVIRNLYVVLTPLRDGESASDIEALFDEDTRLKKHEGRCFNTVLNRNDKDDLSKNAFATHIIKKQKTSINFSNFKCLLNRISGAIDHYAENGSVAKSVKTDYILVL